MYICDDCGAEFDEPRTERQSVPYGMGNAHFDFYVCPECGSENFSECDECRECGKAIDEDNNFGGLCAECIHEDCNLPITVFDFSVDSRPDEISDFAIKCLGAKGINDLLRKYFEDISTTDYTKFEKERKEYVDEYLVNIGEWLTEQDEKAANNGET